MVTIAVHPDKHVSSKVERCSHKVVMIEEGSRSTVSFTVASLVIRHSSAITV